MTESVSYEFFCIFVLGNIKLSLYEENFNLFVDDRNGFEARFEEFKITHLPDQRRLEWLKKNKE